MQNFQLSSYSFDNYFSSISERITIIWTDILMVPDYGVDKYDIGSGFGHFGVAVEDVSYS